MDESIESVTAPFLQSDLAQEVRQVYFEQTGVGVDAGPATHAVFQRFGDLLGDPNEGPVVLLAIAAVQLQAGAVLPPIREAALAMIDDGTAARAWRQSDIRSIKQRAAALEALGRQLADAK
ncbi:MAG: hypothetical protein ACTHM6_11080 [Tepidisphaeraceae bacterium]